MARCLNGSSGPNIIDSNERQANARMDGRPDIWRVSSVDKGRAGPENGSEGGSGKLNGDSFCNLIALPTNVMQRLN